MTALLTPQTRFSFSELEAFTDDQKLVGDENSDSTVDSADALDVLRYSVGLSANENI